MIDIAASLIKDELNAYLELAYPSFPSNMAVLANIADLGEPNVTDIDDNIVITNVIIEEESSLKNKRNYQQSVNGGIDYLEPPVYLNLYLLFCATFQKNTTDGYEIALQRISAVIQFFQAKNVFTINSSPFSSIAITGTLNDIEKAEIKLRAELYTLTFEQTNHLWGALGGKQSPSVMYKIRLVKIQERILQEAPLIEEIQENGISL